MYQGSFQEMLDDMLEHPDELFISSNDRHCALYSTQDGAFLFLQGDFSGSFADCEAEVRRIMNDIEERKRIATIKEVDP